MVKCTCTVMFKTDLTKRVDSNTTEDPTRVNCPKDVRIDYTNATHVTSTTTTYVPPTGIPGMKGATGEQVHFHLLFSISSLACGIVNTLLVF